MVTTFIFWYNDQPMKWNINEFYLGTINYNYSGRSIMKRNKFRKIGTVNTCYGYEMGWGNSLDQGSLFQAVAAGWKYLVQDDEIKR